MNPYLFGASGVFSKFRLSSCCVVVVVVVVVLVYFVVESDVMPNFLS